MNNQTEFPIQTPFGAATEDSISKCELLRGFSFPTDYRRFLQMCNGGLPSRTLCVVPKLQTSVVVDVFFGINLKRDFDLEFWWREFGDEMPPYCSIIGGDPGGNLFLLAGPGLIKGVLYWDHLRNFSRSSDKENTYQIADSFTEFLEILV